jgi:hypothetical protein
MHFGLTALRGDFLESLVSAVVSGFAAAVLDVVPVAISTSKARPRILENYTLISAPKRRATHDGMCSLRPDSRRLWNQIRAAHGVRRLICANEPTLTPPSATGPAALARLLLKTAEHRGAGLRNGRICGLAAGHRRPATLFDERSLLLSADCTEEPFGNPGICRYGKTDRRNDRPYQRDIWRGIVATVVTLSDHVLLACMD